MKSRLNRTDLISEVNMDNLKKNRGKVVKKYETLEQTHYILRYMTDPGSRNCIASELDIALQGEKLL